MRRIVENGKTYVIREGQRIEVETLALVAPEKAPHKPFEAEWVKVPKRWLEALRQSNSTNTYRLALAILAEAFKRQHVGGDIVLSKAMSGMPHSTRFRAARELAKLGLIQLHRQNSNKQSYRVGLRF